MNKSIYWLLILLSISAFTSLAWSHFRKQVEPAQVGYSIQGVGLHWSDEDIESLLGPELPLSTCPAEGSHGHYYEGSVYVVLSTPRFVADSIYGNQLECDGNVILAAGDSTSRVKLVMPDKIELDSTSRLTGKPRSGYFLTQPTPMVQWVPSRAKGTDQSCTISYSYESDGPGITDGHDFAITVWAYEGKITRLSLEWMGH
jgi:hypothetical protein